MTQSAKHKLQIVNEQVVKPKRWRSDAEKQSLPLATRTDGKGAPVLDVMGVLKQHDISRLLGKK